MEPEVQGQPAPEPTVEEMAATVAKGMLEAEEGPPVTQEKPRDDKGKFAKAQPEAEAQPEQPAEEPAPEEPEVETPQEEVRRLKLKYKGEEKEFLEPEVIELAQKGYDYTQKSQALAKEREELTAKVKQEVEAKQQHFEQQLEALKLAAFKLADQEAMTADLNKLAMEDPAKAQQLFFKRMEINQTLAQIAQEQQKLATKRQEEMRAAIQSQAKQAVEVLQQEIPGWSNDLYRDVLKSGVEQYGFKAEEVSAITDPRAIKVLHDAMKYRALQAKPVVDKRSAAPIPKVAKPGSAEKPDAGAEKWNQGMAKLKQTGRSEDAVMLAKMMLAREAKQQK